MHTDDPVLDLMDRFTAAHNSRDLDAVVALVIDDIVFESTSPPPDGARYEGRDAVRQIWGEMLAATPQARFFVEEQFSDGAGRAVVRWRYEWGDGHVRGVDLVRVRDGQLAESLAYVKGNATPGRTSAFGRDSSLTADRSDGPVVGRRAVGTTEQPVLRATDGLLADQNWYT